VSNLTPAQIISTLSTISKDIDEATDEIARLDEQAVRARATYKTAYARAFLGAEGSMDIRRYTAELETAEAHLESELADQQHRASVSAIKALRDRLEVGRSLGPLVRLEWGQA
jgi:hypothetical protein|tara:strand:- start:99 stop:437 length:339 start_codon:yes stop_codon:yes gene_type:complete